jgi:hypothetical protein
MKRMILFALFFGAAVFCFSQSATLDIALSGAKTYIETQLPLGTRVLIIDPAAPVRELGVYAGQELSTRLVNGRRVTVVERSANVMQSLDAENMYQLSGNVSDASIQSIGQQTGAQVIITGIITGLGDSYRLSVKITSVRTAELLGQYNINFQTDTVMNALLARNNPPRGKPSWIYEPLTARTKYEDGGSISGVSLWYYDVGISNKTTSEQTSRTRARQNIQHVIAENIASDIKSRIDITSFSMFESSGIEETENRIESVLTNSIRTRVPRYETLEWYIETGQTDGRTWYMAYVLVRFPRSDIITMVEQINPPVIVNTIIRQMNITASNNERDDLIRQLESARDRALDIIKDGISDN